jgi:predicted ATP-grasp superfamily ATP-dependent carboligase
VTRALVADAHLRSSLAGIRALSRAGIEVLGLAAQRSAPGLWSSVLAGRSVDGRAEGGAESRWLAVTAAAGGPVVVYPGQESTIDALARHVGADSEVLVPYASAEGLRAVRDKAGLERLAESAGLRAPVTVVRATAAELRRSPPAPPLVIKPVFPGQSLATARPLGSAEETAAVLAALPDDEPLLVQERLGGPLTALGLVVDYDGRLTASFQQVATRTWPVAAGASSVALSVALDRELAERCAAMLHAAGYAGLAELQFMQGVRGPALIDVNPRFYGSLSLAVACGVNLPGAWHALVTGTPAPRPSEYRLGVSYRWLEGDLLAAMRGSPRRLFPPPPRPRVGAVWSARDPLPGVVMAIDAVRLRAARRLPGGRPA